MSSTDYIEDLFLDFWDKASYDPFGHQEIKDADFNAGSNFYKILTSGSLLTKKQADYMIRLIKNYGYIVYQNRSDYSQVDNPVFKNRFREIDYSKSIYIDHDDYGMSVVCLKFPYNFKSTFEKEFNPSQSNLGYAVSYWDQDKNARVLNFYEHNILKIYDFVKSHGFEIHESFLEAVSEVEIAWELADSIIPHSKIDNGKILLYPSDNPASEYFNEHKSNVIEKDMFLAKTMGFPLIQEKNKVDTFEKLTSSYENVFWLKEATPLIDIYKKIEDKICIVLDRNQNNWIWIKNFIELSDKAGIPREKIKVCFRHDSTKNQGFNEWVKDNDLGGLVSKGDILIFEHKLPKWLIKEKNYCKIVATTEVNPSTNTHMQNYCFTHPCFIVLSDIMPTRFKEVEIVDL